MAGFVAVRPGSVFAGDFRIVRPLAEGGMGAVYIVEQISTGKQRALKLMHPTLAPDEKSRARFAEEARIGSRIASEHVVDVVAAGVDAETGMPWLCMELLEGCDLEQLVTHRGALPAAEVLDILEQAAHALADAHAKGIVHRDLKPQNLFLARSRRTRGDSLLKILDFGIARMIEGSRTSATVTSAIGSPMWMAPEQAQSGAKLRPSTDVWALGLIAFYLLTARSFWRAANAPEFNLSALLVEMVAQPIPPASDRARELGLGVRLPRGFDAWFARCVDREPEQRFPTAAEALAALPAALDTSPSVAVSVQTTAPLSSAVPTQPIAPPAVDPRHAASAAVRPEVHAARRTAGSKLPLIAGVGVFVLLGIGGVVALAWPPGEAEPRREEDDLGADTEPAIGVGHVTIESDIEGARLFVDATDRGALVSGTRVDVAPGAHRFEARVDDSVMQTAMVTVLPDEDARVSLLLPAAEEPPDDLAIDPPPTVAELAIRGRVTTEGLEDESGAGLFDATIVTRQIRAQLPRMQTCYERLLRNDRRLADRLLVRFTVLSSGTVASASVSESTTRNAELAACALAPIRQLRFVPGPEGGSITYSYRFVFAAADEAGAAPVPPRTTRPPEHTTRPRAECGNGVCERGETCRCDADCGRCAPPENPF